MSEAPKREDVEALAQRLLDVSNMINLGERISWGQETALMDEAAAMLRSLIAERAAVASLRGRMRGERGRGMSRLIGLAAVGTGAQAGSLYEQGDLWGMLACYGFAIILGALALRMAHEES